MSRSTSLGPASGVLVLEVVVGLDDQEAHERHDQEVHDRRQYVPDEELAVADVDHDRAEVRLPEDRSDQVEDDAVDDRRDDRSEEQRQDERDRQFDEVAPVDELLELADHVLHADLR